MWLSRGAVLPNGLKCYNIKLRLTYREALHYGSPAAFSKLLYLIVIRYRNGISCGFWSGGKYLPSSAFFSESPLYHKTNPSSRFNCSKFGTGTCNNRSSMFERKIKTFFSSRSFIPRTTYQG